MSKPTVNLITSPDKLLNGNLSFLLLNPSVTVKEQFNDMLKELSDAPINLYLSEDENDIAWVLDVAQSVNYIIIDIDIDEIVYASSYDDLILELNKANKPISIKLNQFFFKNTYLWSNLIFDAPAIYKYKMVRNMNKTVKGVVCKYQRYCSHKTSKIYGCHMSWVMPVDDMLKKIYSGAHTKYHHLGKREILEKAIEDKKYVFDLKRPFDIIELNITDVRIPTTLQRVELFDFLS